MLKLSTPSFLRDTESFDYILCGFDVPMNLIVAYLCARRGKTVFIYDREDKGMPEEFYLLNTSRICLSNTEIINKLYKVAEFNFPETNDIVTLCRYIVHSIKQDYDEIVRFTQKWVLDPKEEYSTKKKTICNLMAMSSFSRAKHDALSKMYTIRERLIRHESVATSEFISAKKILLTTPVFNFTDSFQSYTKAGIAKRALKVGVKFDSRSRIDDYNDIGNLISSGFI